MPPAVVAVAAAVASWAVTTYVSSAILAAVLLVAINVAATALTRKATNRSLEQGQELQLKLDPTMPRQVALGLTATGGSLVWAFTYPPTSANKDIPPNRYLVRIVDLSDLPINGVVKILEGVDALTFSSDYHAGFAACNQHRKKSGAAAMWVKIHRGSPDAVADSELITMSGGLWTSKHKGTNIAYAIVKFDYDQDAFPNGEPSLTFVMEGAKLYDDRYDSTKPLGDGPQRLDDPSTWVFSRNAAVITSAVLRGLYSKGVLVYGAQAEERDLSQTMLYSAYNTCEEAVPKADGQMQQRYAAGLMVTASDATSVALLDLQSAMDGRIIDRGGAITILPGAVRTPVFHLTDDDVIWTNESSWQPRAALSDLLNHVVGTFVDEETGFQEKAFPTLRNPAWEQQDGGERFSTQYAFRAATNRSQVQRITNRIHKASRLQGTIAFVMPLFGLEAEQGDWFTMTSVRKGFTNKTFEIKNLDVSSALSCAIAAREVSPTPAEWNPAVDEVPRSDTRWNPPVRILPIPELEAIGITQTTTNSLDASYKVAVSIEGFAEGNAATNIQLEYAPVGSTAATGQSPLLNAENQTYYIDDVLPSANYQVRGRSLSGSSVGVWSDWVTVETPSSAGNNLYLYGFDAVTIGADANGVINPGALPEEVALSLYRGSVNVTKDASWAIQAGSGITATIDNTPDSDSRGVVSISAMGVSKGSIKVTALYKGTQIIGSLTVQKGVASAGNPDAPSGTPASTGAFTVNNTSTHTDMTGWISVIVGPQGTVSLTAPLSYSVRLAAGTASTYAAVKWQYSEDMTVVSDVAAETQAEYGAYNVKSGTQTLDEGGTYQDGFVSASVVKTGLTPGERAYFKLQSRKVSGAFQITSYYGTATATPK